MKEQLKQLRSKKRGMPRGIPFDFFGDKFLLADF
jgi:hypothetical protein